MAPCFGLTFNLLPLILVAGGTGFFLVGGIFMLAGGGQLVVDHEYQKNLAIVPETESYQSWRHLPGVIYMSVYFFHLKNKDAVVAGTAKPDYVQKGPYVWEERHWNTEDKRVGRDGYTADGEFVTYTLTRKWTFSPEKSKGNKLSDKVTTVNPILAGLIGFFSDPRHESVTRPVGANLVATVDGGILNNTGIWYTKKSISQLMFEGYDVKNDETTAPLWHGQAIEVGEKLPEWYGYYYTKNNTDLIFKVNTGKKDISKLGQLAAWNCRLCHDDNGTLRGFYSGVDFVGDCAKVHGAGDFFPPHRDKTYLEFFAPDLCRPLKLTFAEEVKTPGGMDVYVYRMDESFLANGKENPENTCFESDLKLPSGMFDATACQPLAQPAILHKPAARAFFSQPHFYQASEKYKEVFSKGSFSPSKNKHETFFHVEPQSGLPVKLTVRLQVNLVLAEPVKRVIKRKLGNWTFHPHIKDAEGNEVDATVAPILWQELSFELPNEVAQKVWLLASLSKVAMTTGIVFILLSLVLAALTTIHFVNRKAKGGENDKDQKAKTPTTEEMAASPLMSTAGQDPEKKNIKGTNQATPSKKLTKAETGDGSKKAGHPSQKGTTEKGRGKDAKIA